MRALAERWCDFPVSIRLGCWLLMLLLAGIACGFSRHGTSVSPVLPGLQAQWRKVMPLRVSEEEMPAFIAMPFSAIEFQSPGRTLVSWQPAASGGELTLDGDWSALVQVFTLLAERNMAVKGFSLVPEQQRLRLTLQLEVIGNE